MKQRITEVLPETTLDASGTKIIDLDLTDPVSMLLFEYKNTRGSNTNAAHVASCITKAELIDGADVLFSLSGKQLHALAYFDLMKTPYTFLTNAVGVMEILALQYHFGRFLWDPQLALDPKRFRNPQIKVTFSRTANDASASAHTLRILGYVFDEQAVSPMGFLMTKELKAYDAGAEGSYEYTDLPTDHIIRKILVQGYYADYQPWQVANEVRISEENDKKIPVDEKVSALMKAMNTLYPKWNEMLYAVLTSGGADFYWTPNFDVVVMGASETASAVISVEGQPLTSPKKLYSSSSGNAVLQVEGFNPHGIVPILFGDQGDLANWYDVTKLGSLKMRIKSGSAGTNGDISIITQQMRKV